MINCPVNDYGFMAIPVRKSRSLSGIGFSQRGSSLKLQQGEGLKPFETFLRVPQAGPFPLCILSFGGSQCLDVLSLGLTTIQMFIS